MSDELRVLLLAIAYALEEGEITRGGQPLRCAP